MDELKQVTPEPVTPGVVKDVQELNRTNTWLANIRQLLRSIQRHSTWPLAVYFPLHAVNTLLVPVLAPNGLPNDILNMIRELLPRPSITNKVLATSIGAHLVTGGVLRVWSWWRCKQHAQATVHRTLVTAIKTSTDSQREIGLTGGLSGYFFGIYKQFNVSPQVLTGYILAPAMAYHLYLMVWGPYSIGKVSEIDFDYVKWILQNENPWIRYLAGLVPLAILIWSGTYHITAGACQYLRIRSMAARRRWSNTIAATCAVGFFSLFRLHNSRLFGRAMKASYRSLFHGLWKS